MIDALPATDEYVDRLIRVFRDRPHDDTSAVILQDYALAALQAPQEAGVKALDDDQIMEIIKEIAPWKNEPQLNDLLTYEKSPPLFPQATYDVPSYRATNFVRAVEKRILSALKQEDAT